MAAERKVFKRKCCSPERVGGTPRAPGRRLRSVKAESGGTGLVLYQAWQMS